MSDIDAHPGVVIPPYHGHGEGRTKRFWRKALIPIMVTLCLVYGLLFGFYGPFLIRLFPIPLGILALLVIWALPEMNGAPTRSMQVFFFLFLLAMILWPNYLAISLPGMPWITLTRLMAVPLAIVFLIALSVSEQFRKSLSDVMAAQPLLWKGVVAFAVLQFLGVFVSKHLGFSFQKMITAQFNWTLIFFVSCYVFIKPGRARLWATLFTLTLPFILLVVVKESHDQMLPWAGHIPDFLKVQDESVARTLAGAHRDMGDYRVQATFSTPLALGEYVALVMPFVLHRIFTPGNLIFRALAAAAVPAAFWAILLSDSRLGLIGCILSLILFLLLYAWMRWKSDKSSIIWPAILFSSPALGAATFAASLVVGRFRERIWGSGQYDASNQARADMFHEGIPMILHRPWGYGVGMGAETLGFVSPAGVLTIDTYYLATGLEYGIIGFLLYYGLFGAAMYISGREAIKVKDIGSEYTLLAPISVALVNFFIIKSVFSSEENHSLVYMMMGMAAALIWRMRKEQAAASPGPVPVK